MKSTYFDQAIVVGDGLAGLLSAQALAEFFGRVIIIPESTIADVAPPVLLHSQDRAALETLFPGLMAELITAGAVRFNLGLHMAWFVYGRWRPRYRSKLESIACSRQLLEERLRRRLQAQAAIKLLSGEEILGLSYPGEDAAQLRPQVNGVRLRGGGELAADLVVDASGQMGRAVDWLQAIGWRGSLPRTGTALLMGINRFYRRPTGGRKSWQALVVQPSGLAAANSPGRGAVILPLEGDRLSLTLLGAAAEAPPLLAEAFLAFARSLPTPTVYEVIRQAVPLGPAQTLTIVNRGPSCSLLPAWPERFIWLPGPSRSPNPVLGQEVSYSLHSRAALSESLERQEASLLGLHGRFQQQLAEKTRLACSLAKAEAQRWAGTPAADSAPMAQYMERVIAASLNSAHVLEALYSVQQLIEPPSLLFRPDIVLQVTGDNSQPASSA